MPKQWETTITIADWAARWFTERIDKWNPNTERGYRNLIYRYIVPGIGEVKLSDLTTERIQTFYTSLVEKGLANKSVLCVHLLLRQFMDEACREHLIVTNPAQGCELPQPEKHASPLMRIGQIERYLDTAEKHGILPIIYIGLTSGLRQCELFTLLWADFDARRRYILRGKRLLQHSEKAAALLEEEHDRHPSSLHAFLNSKTGAPYQLHEFYYLHRKVLKTARLPWIAFRDLARLCQEAGL